MPRLSGPKDIECDRRRHLVGAVQAVGLLGRLAFGDPEKRAGEYGREIADRRYGRRRGFAIRGNVIRKNGLRSRIPVTTFEQATYWDSNYRSRPFYDEHHYWSNLNTEAAKREEEQVRQEIVKQEVRDEMRANESAAIRSSGGRR